MTISKQKKWFCILNLAVGLISGQLCAANLAKSKNMLAVLLFGTKNMKIKRMPRNGELPRIMQVLDLKPRSPVCWRSKSWKTISLTGVYFVLFNESSTQAYIDRRHLSTSPLESFFDSHKKSYSSWYFELKLVCKWIQNHPKGIWSLCHQELDLAHYFPKYKWEMKVT